MGALHNWSWALEKEAFLKYLTGQSKTLDGFYVNAADKEKLSQIKELIDKYGYSPSTVVSILEGYKPETLLQDQLSPVLTKMLTDLQEMDTWEAALGKAPDLPDPDQYFQEAQDAIDSEDARLNALYDEIFGTQRNMLQNELDENNAMFNDYRNQMLSSGAMGQQAIAGATRFELDRQQRNAITRGASAAQRLVANINTQLGLQASSAQQALDTSNALAQTLLNHRQAQQGIRNSYMEASNSDALRRADLLKGRAERVTNYQNSRLGQAMDAYDIKKSDYDDRRSNIYGTNPWGSAWTSYYTKKYSNGL